MPIPVMPAALVRVSGTYFGELVENVWHIGITGGSPPPTTDIDTALAIFQTFYPDIVAPLSDQLQINSFYARSLSEGPYETELFSTPAIVGGSASPGLPGGSAFCIRLKTALPGRQFRGRKYFSGLTEAGVTGNAVGSAVADAIAGGINDLRAALETNGTPLVIASYTYATVTTVTQAGYFDLNVDSMRRRLAGRGR